MTDYGLVPWSRASNDNIRLWNASDTGLEAESAAVGAGGRSRSGVPFKIIPGHHGGIVSQMRKGIEYVFCSKAKD